MLEEKKKALKMEYDYFMYMGTPVPQVITDDMYDKLLNTDCGEHRRRLWEMFSRHETAGDMGLAMKRRMASFRMARMMNEVKNVEKDNFDGKIYDENGKNKAGVPENLIIRIDPKYVKSRYDHRVVHGVQFGQNIVFDLGLPFCMDRGAERRFNLHMKSVYNRNRTLWDPFNIFMCNYDSNNPALKRLVEDDSCARYLWNVTPKCFTDIFPREKIVYLSPKSNNVLTKYNHDDVYVIGATGSDGQSLCHIRVKELGIRSARFNTDPYFLRASKNNFNVKEVFRIMLDARDTNSNWLYSLRHLSNPRMKTMRWRHKYQYLENYVDEDTKNQSTTPWQDTLEITESQSLEQVFTNERSLLKPRHEDAHLFNPGDRGDSNGQTNETVEDGPSNREDELSNRQQRHSNRQNRLSNREGGPTDGPLNVDHHSWHDFGDSPEDAWNFEVEQNLKDSL